MRIVRVTICFCGLMLFAGCSKEPPPVSVTEFMENPRLLEATMVRCGQNRSEMKYVAECVNARDAVNRIEASEKKTRREELERQSERKRQALRRTQEAAAEARRRAMEEQRRREEAEYLGIFDDQTASQNVSAGTTQSPAANAPTAEVAPPPAEAEEQQAEIEETAADPTSDLGAIREELKRRQQAPQN